MGRRPKIKLTEPPELTEDDYIPGQRYDSRRKAALKQAIIELIEAEEADNLSQACDKLKIPKLRAYQWRKQDEDWSNLLNQAEQIKADRLETELDNLKNVVGIIFRLKKLRPEYREKYQINIRNDGLKILLEELRNLSRRPEIIEGEYKEIPERLEEDGYRTIT